MRRLIQSELEDVLAEKFLKHELDCGERVYIDRDGERLVFKEFEFVPCESEMQS